MKAIGAGAGCLAVFFAAGLFPVGVLAATPRIAYEQFSLPNGLRVLISSDASVPLVAQAMIFDVGARQEVPGRSGFAHLFEHLMFAGSQNVPKGGFDKILESYGGDNNAATHEDFTFYYEVVPAHALPVALWLDADRVGALNVSKDAVAKQIEVVKEEKRMRVDNEPYGPLLDSEISSRTFSNWQNRHSIMGEFEDLNRAGLKDVQAFFETYYAPSNAFLAVVGDVTVAEAKRWVTEFFGNLPNREKPAPTDTTEPEPGPGRTFAVADAQAKLPALAAAWKLRPRRQTADFFALAILGRALCAGKSSRLYQELVKNSQIAVEVQGGLGFPGSDESDYQAPALFGVFVIHNGEHKPEEVRRLLLAQIARIAAEGLPAAELERLKTKFRSDWLMSQQTRLNRAEKLLVAAILDGDPNAANALDSYLAVTSADVQRAAANYLKPELANIFEVVPGGKH